MRTRPPIHVRDDFVACNGRYVSRSFASYPNGEPIELGYVDILHFMAETEALHTGESKGRLRAPFLDEYFSLKPKKAEASDAYEWLGHILVPAKAALTDRLCDKRLVLTGIKKSSSMQLVNSVSIHRDGNTTVLEADPKETYELDFGLPENIEGGDYVINEGLMDSKTGFLKRGIRSDGRGGEPVRGSMSIAHLDFVALQPYVIRGRGTSELYLEPLDANDIETNKLRFASYVNPQHFMKAGKESLILVQSKAGEILRDKILALQKRIEKVQKMDSGATIGGRSLEMELEELEKISRRYFPKNERNVAEAVRA